MLCLWRRLIISRVAPLTLRNSEVATKHVHHLVCPSLLKKTSTLASLQNKGVNYNALRGKSKKAKAEEDDDEVENYNDDASLNRDSKVVKLNTTSLRTDLILKSALGIARNKIEQQFYESKIRLNGKKVLKKSVSVRVGDEVDIVKMVSPKNQDHIYVSRVEILNIAVKDETIVVTARRFKNLLIDNYETDPYKAGSAEIERSQ